MKSFPVYFMLLAATAAFAGTPDSRPASQSLSAEAQEDLGDLRPVEDVPWSSFFHGSAQVQGQYTANALLKGNEGSSDFLWMPTLQGGYTVPLNKQFTLESTARLETVAYSRFQDHGFYGVSGDVTLDYQARPNLPHLYLGVQPYYYLGFDTNDQVGEAVAFSTGITDAHFLCRGRTMIFSGYNFSEYVASPSLDNRDSHRAIIGVTQQLTPAAYAQLFYAFQFSNFQDQSRRDARHVVGLNMVYQFTEKLFGSVSVSFINNHSTNSLASYQSLVFGTGLTYQF